MQKIIGSCALIGLCGAAQAHELSSDAGLPARLGHEILGLHHLPLTALLVVVLLLLLRTRRANIGR